MSRPDQDAFIYRDGKIEPFEDRGIGRGYAEPITELRPVQSFIDGKPDIIPIKGYRRYVEHRFATHKTIVEFGKVTYVPIKESVLYLPSDMVLTSEIKQEMIAKLEGRRA